MQHVMQQFLIVKNIPFLEQARPKGSEHLCNLRFSHWFSMPFFAHTCSLQSYSPLTDTQGNMAAAGGAAGRTRRQRCSCQDTSILGCLQCTVMQDLYSGGAFVSGAPRKTLPSGSAAAASGPQWRITEGIVQLQGPCKDRRGTRSQHYANPLAGNLFQSVNLQSVLWLAPLWRFPKRRWLWHRSQIRVGAAWRSDSDVQDARYPPAGRVFQSLITARLNAK